MPGRAAREDDHAGDGPEPLDRDVELAEKDPARLERRAPEHRLAGRPRLLEDLLQHEVPVAGLLRHHRVPVDALGVGGDRRAREIGVGHAAGGDDGHLAVAQEHDVPAVPENRGDVRRDETAAVALDHEDRRALADRHQLPRVVGRQQHQGEQPAHPGEGAADRRLEPVPPPCRLDEVGDDLGVGLRREAVALGLELSLQREVVLDDAVVHDDDAPAAVAVGMRVLLGRPAVRRPARVAEAVVAVDRIVLEGLDEAVQLAGAAAQLDRVAADQGHAGRVVAAVLQPPEPFEEDRHDGSPADVADDSAHFPFSRLFRGRPANRSAPAFASARRPTRPRRRPAATDCRPGHPARRLQRSRARTAGGSRTGRPVAGLVLLPAVPSVLDDLPAAGHRQRPGGGRRR